MLVEHLDGPDDVIDTAEGRERRTVGGLDADDVDGRGIVGRNQRGNDGSGEIRLARPGRSDDQHMWAIVGKIELDRTRFADAHGDAQPATLAARAPVFVDAAGVEPIGIDQ